MKIPLYPPCYYRAGRSPFGFDLTYAEAERVNVACWDAQRFFQRYGRGKRPGAVVATYRNYANAPTTHGEGATIDANPSDE